MGIESKAKILFNEISCGLLHLIGPALMHKPFKDRGHLTNNLMKPIPPIGEKEKPPIDMRNYDYPPGYVSNDESGCSYDFLLEKEKPHIDMGGNTGAYPPGYFNS